MVHVPGLVSLVLLAVAAVRRRTGLDDRPRADRARDAAARDRRAGRGGVVGRGRSDGSSTARGPCRSRPTSRGPSARCGTTRASTSCVEVLDDRTVRNQVNPWLDDSVEVYAGR